ncbi:hypothetical protein [Massilia sp. CF038]|uniref:hypothetical protein n=1 Tax=Massilia sp. CF038 TaxID=1881045 RepID=UPI0009165461|nr:hypothetical protein [Massilia sp. CF038]SHG47820.1 hypothetical protein SAMN05428948_0654 [Massilia sp. CF038]
MFSYMEARADDDPALLVIGLHGSPWHLYGPDQRIMEPSELAAQVRTYGPVIKKVVLLSSWSGIAPGPGSKSVAQRLALALDGTQVVGQDGFTWFAKDGAVHTTRQAFSTYVSRGPYRVERGGDVMAAMVSAAAISMEADWRKAKNARGMLGVGAGYDQFSLCPDKAMQAFEAGATFGSAIAAYNAALMRLERNEPGDRKAALALLARAAALGDAPAKARLASVGAPGAP